VKSVREYLRFKNEKFHAKPGALVPDNKQMACILRVDLAIGAQ
jgi:hypothetical protein